MKHDNLDAMGKTNRLLVPPLVILLLVLMGASLAGTVQYLLEGGKLPVRSEVQLVGDGLAIVYILIALVQSLWKSINLKWLMFLSSMGWIGARAYEFAGLEGLGWMAIAVAIFGVVGLVARKNAPNFGRAGLEP